MDHFIDNDIMIRENAINSSTVETVIDHIRVSGKWVEFWFHNDPFGHGLRFHASEKYGNLLKAVGEADLEDHILNNGYKDVVVTWKRNGGNWDIDKVSAPVTPLVNDVPVTKEAASLVDRHMQIIADIFDPQRSSKYKECFEVANKCAQLTIDYCTNYNDMVADGHLSNVLKAVKEYNPNQIILSFTPKEESVMFYKEACIREKIIGVVTDITGLERDEITDSSDIYKDLGFDSLDAVEFIMKLEKELDITIDDELLEMRNLKIFDIIKFIETANKPTS